MYKKSSIIALLISWLLFSPIVYALDLQYAKSQGLVGEMANGYLGSPKGQASADVSALMAEINSKRKKKYAEIAVKQGVDLTVVEKLAGAKAQKKTKAGHYIQTPAGQWTQR